MKKAEGRPGKIEARTNIEGTSIFTPGLHFTLDPQGPSQLELEIIEIKHLLTDNEPRITTRVIGQDIKSKEMNFSQAELEQLMDDGRLVFSVIDPRVDFLWTSREIATSHRLEELTLEVEIALNSGDTEKTDFFQQLVDNNELIELQNNYYYQLADNTEITLLGVSSTNLYRVNINGLLVELSIGELSNLWEKAKRQASQVLKNEQTEAKMQRVQNILATGKGILISPQKGYSWHIHQYSEKIIIFDMEEGKAMSKGKVFPLDTGWIKIQNLLLENASFTEIDLQDPDDSERAMNGFVKALKLATEQATFLAKDQNSVWWKFSSSSLLPNVYEASKIDSLDDDPVIFELLEFSPFNPDRFVEVNPVFAQKREQVDANKISRLLEEGNRVRLDHTRLGVFEIRRLTTDLVQIIYLQGEGSIQNLPLAEFLSGDLLHESLTMAAIYTESEPYPEIKLLVDQKKYFEVSKVSKLGQVRLKFYPPTEPSDTWDVLEIVILEGREEILSQQKVTFIDQYISQPGIRAAFNEVILPEQPPFLNELNNLTTTNTAFEAISADNIRRIFRFNAAEKTWTMELYGKVEPVDIQRYQLSDPSLASHYAKGVNKLD